MTLPCLWISLPFLFFLFCVFVLRSSVHLHLHCAFFYFASIWVGVPRSPFYALCGALCLGGVVGRAVGRGAWRRWGGGGWRAMLAPVSVFRFRALRILSLASPPPPAHRTAVHDLFHFRPFTLRLIISFSLYLFIIIIFLFLSFHKNSARAGFGFYSILFYFFL